MTGILPIQNDGNIMLSTTTDRKSTTAGSFSQIAINRQADLVLFRSAVLLTGISHCHFTWEPFRVSSCFIDNQAVVLFC